jgi:hypothetical protein
VSRSPIPNAGTTCDRPSQLDDPTDPAANDLDADCDGVGAALDGEASLDASTTARTTTCSAAPEWDDELRRDGIDVRRV